MSSNDLSRYLADASSQPRPGWTIDLADRGDGAFVATITRHGEMMCRITRMASREQDARAEAHLHADRWIEDYIARTDELQKS